jgi:hypothetical protein
LFGYILGERLIINTFLEYVSEYPKNTKQIPEDSDRVKVSRLSSSIFNKDFAHVYVSGLQMLEGLGFLQLGGSRGGRRQEACERRA